MSRVGAASPAGPAGRPCRGSLNRRPAAPSAVAVFISGIRWCQIGGRALTGLFAVVPNTPLYLIDTARPRTSTAAVGKCRVRHRPHGVFAGGHT